MDILNQRVDTAEKDIQDLKAVWRLIGKIEKQYIRIEETQKTILEKLNAGHPCNKEQELQELKDFKKDAEDRLKNSISQNQAIIYVGLTAMISFVLGNKF